MRRFRDQLVALGVNATIRVTRGAEIDAACGQLAASPRSAPRRMPSGCSPGPGLARTCVWQGQSGRASCVPRCSGSCSSTVGIVVLTKLAVSRTAYDKVDEMTGDALPPRETLQALLDRDRGGARGRGGGRRAHGHASRALAPRLEAADPRRGLSLPPVPAAVLPSGLTPPALAEPFRRSAASLLMSEDRHGGGHGTWSRTWSGAQAGTEARRARDGDGGGGVSRRCRTGAGAHRQRGSDARAGCRRAAPTRAPISPSRALARVRARLTC